MEGQSNGDATVRRQEPASGVRGQRGSGEDSDGDSGSDTGSFQGCSDGGSSYSGEYNYSAAADAAAAALDALGYGAGGDGVASAAGDGPEKH